MSEKIPLGSKSHIVSLRKSGEDFTIQVDGNSFEGKFLKNLDGSVKKLEKLTKEVNADTESLNKNDDVVIPLIKSETELNPLD